MPAIRVLHVNGYSYTMGYRHGLAYADQIHSLTHERIRLSTEETWTGRNLPRPEVLALAEQCIDAHGNYAPDLLEELEGVAAATGLSLAELIITNGFTDFADAVYAAGGDPVAVPARAGNECTTFMASQGAHAEHGLIGQTWDMHATATPHVIMLDGKPKNAPEFLLFTLTGCVGMIGMNEAGIAVGINNLTASDGKPGVTWNFVVRKILAQDNLEDALACITSAPLAGGHNYMLMDATGRGYNVEATSTVCVVEEVANGQTFAHANMCLDERTQAVERDRTADLIEDSEKRVKRANQLLAEQRPATPEAMMAITRDRSDGSYSICAMAEPPFYSETCGAVIMRPSSRDFWGVWGIPLMNDYQHFKV